MRTNELFHKLQGVQTIESVMALLKVDKTTAIRYVHRLRKSGYIKTRKRNDQSRIYSISFENKLKGVSYYEIINANSPVKISAPNIYNIYGREPSIEETIVFAIKTKSLRTILAALGLFRRVQDWSELYRLGKQNRVERQIGALHDLVRKIMPKTRRMFDRFRHNALPKDHYPFEYTVPDIQSKDFKEIENTWKVYLPFNRKDLGAYHDIRR